MSESNSSSYERVEENANVAKQTMTFVEPKWTSALALIMSGIALGIAIIVIYVQATAYHELELEVRLLQLQNDNFRVALLARGIDPAPHLKGDAP